VIDVRQHNLIPLLERLADRQAYDSNKRRRIHSKGDFAGFLGIQEDRHCLPRPGNRGVHFAALAIASASLHIALEQMAIDCIEPDLWDLSASSIVKEDEGRVLGQGRE